ncbi:MAG TPA: DUF5916 domain-containing protein [Bacteroidales bacterium]|nr:DUF5916 domain-containing protein [Bacteroidales bacterium]
MKRSLFINQFLLIFSLIIATSLFLSASGQSASGQQDTIVKQNSFIQPVYTTTRLITAKPVIDGKLDDECWNTGVWAGDYHQFIPNEGAKPTYPTEMKILYDDKNLYIAFRAYDGEPDKIQRLSGVRDDIVGDMVGITFDSYHDHRTGFEFTVTAWGQKVDLVLFNPASWDFNWNAVWKVKTGLEDSAWVAEYEVPLNQLRYSKEEEQVWGMHTWRWINRLQEESNWEIQSKTGPGMLYNFGELRGIKGLKKSQRLEVMPYALGDLKTMKKEPGNPFADKGRAWGGNIGLDAKIGISSNFTIDLTVNPDFGQVESDPSVMNLTAFETFYEEKRPFFLEGLTIFDYKFDNQSLFYSRRIGHAPSRTVDPADDLFVKSTNKTSILSAIKLSGTTSEGLSVGLIQSVTANEFATLSDEYGNKTTTKVEPLTNYMVARIQKGYKAGTTVIGGMLTSTNRSIEDENLQFLSNDAYTGGLDLLHHWKDKEFFIDARLIGSYINGSTEAITALQESSARYYQRPGADYLRYDTTSTSLSGYGGKFRIGKGSKGLWKYSTGITWLSPGLELNDLGYMNSADQINQENDISYLINKPASIFRTYSIGLEQFNSWNFNGLYLGSGGHLQFISEFKNQWGFSTNLIYHSKAFDTKILRGGFDMMMPQSITSFGRINTDMSKKFTAGVAYSYENRGSNSAVSYQLEPGITIRPISTLKIGLSANFSENNDRLQYVATRDYMTEKRYILGTIDQKTLGLTFRVDMNLTPEFSIQYYGSPFISRGTYSEFKRVTDPEASAYNDRFAVFQSLEVIGGSYGLDENNDGNSDYFISNPDFNFHEFRSNLVAKWEYRLGSFIYLVWSSERSGVTGSSGATIGDSYRQLWDVFPNNIFLIKLNYWFSL